MDLTPYIAKHVVNLPRSASATSLNRGEMDDVIRWHRRAGFRHPWHIRRPHLRARKGRTHYTSNLGLIELRRAINRYLEKHIGVSYRPGRNPRHRRVSEALDVAFRALVNPATR